MALIFDLIVANQLEFVAAFLNIDGMNIAAELHKNDW